VSPTSGADDAVPADEGSLTLERIAALEKKTIFHDGVYGGAPSSSPRPAGCGSTPRRQRATQPPPPAATPNTPARVEWDVF
jgi:hypothetical protein